MRSISSECSGSVVKGRTVVYERGGADEHTGEGDGPTSADFRYVEAEGDIDPSADERDDRSTLDD